MDVLSTVHEAAIANLGFLLAPHESSEAASTKEFFADTFSLFSSFRVNRTQTFADVVLSNPESSSQTPIISEEAHEVKKAVLNAIVGRRLAITKERLIGLVPVCAKVDDVVVILLGCLVPVVLRKCEENWTFIGTCYMEGIMEGEVVKDLASGRYNAETFEIR